MLCFCYATKQEHIVPGGLVCMIYKVGRLERQGHVEEAVWLATGVWAVLPPEQRFVNVIFMPDPFHRVFSEASTINLLLSAPFVA